MPFFKYWFNIVYYDFFWNDACIYIAAAIKYIILTKKIKLKIHVNCIKNVDSWLKPQLYKFWLLI